jgi:transcriptional regulator of arginine metabolism
MKRSRHEKIIELIQTQAICTQEDLAEKLKAEGFSVTQATVSRDIRELGLSKVAAPSGRQRYIALGPVRGEGARGGEERYVRVLREALSSAEAAGNILVLKTASGMAMAAASALDALGYPEVVGCVAGDDTIFAAAHTAQEARELLEKVGSTTGCTFSVKRAVKGETKERGNAAESTC